MGGDGHSPAAALSLGLEKPRETTNKPDQHHSRHQVQPPVKRITGDISQGKGGREQATQVDSLRCCDACIGLAYYTVCQRMLRQRPVNRHMGL